MFMIPNATNNSKVTMPDGISQSNIFAEIFAEYNMESKLIVKNFGPITQVELDLRNVNVFIGPQATGKSALAKLYTIFKAPRKFFYKIDTDKNGTLVLDHEKASREFTDVLEEYNIRSFLKPETEIEFNSELHKISYKKGLLKYEPKLYETIAYLDDLATDYKLNERKIAEKLRILADKFILFSIRAGFILRKAPKKWDILSNVLNDLNEYNYPEVIEAIRSIEKDLSTNTALYIPAERTFSNIIKKSALNLLLNKVPIPKHILSFGAELEKLEIDEIPLRFIKENLVYKVINGDDRVYIDSNNSIMLAEAASGIQSVIPVLAPIMSIKHDSHRSFVIEEPELNLFPIAQYELIQLLEASRNDSTWEDYGTIHTYTTHSPYILSALNNLLYAYKVKGLLNARDYALENDFLEINFKNNEIVKKIVSAVIDPNSFTAYQINDGEAKSIFNRETGLIEGNYIDEASDKINEDFEALMELTK